MFLCFYLEIVFCVTSYIVTFTVVVMLSSFCYTYLQSRVWLYIWRICSLQLDLSSNFFLFYNTVILWRIWICFLVWTATLKLNLAKTKEADSFKVSWFVLVLIIWRLSSLSQFIDSFFKNNVMEMTLSFNCLQVILQIKLVVDHQLLWNIARFWSKSLFPILCRLSVYNMMKLYLMTLFLCMNSKPPSLIIQ